MQGKKCCDKIQNDLAPVYYAKCQEDMSTCPECGCSSFNVNKWNSVAKCNNYQNLSIDYKKKCAERMIDCKDQKCLDKFNNKWDYKNLCNNPNFSKKRSRFCVKKFDQCLDADDCIRQNKMYWTSIGTCYDGLSNKNRNMCKREIKDCYKLDPDKRIGCYRHTVPYWGFHNKCNNLEDEDKRKDCLWELNECHDYQPKKKTKCMKLLDYFD